ncbi:hypothetical protein BLTE_11620 [Blastochloris tepida]|uniref:Uncharacterized protein n=1 Tax=Blastochloris tepida TaxID=2233851 RepID=A0A348FYU4_9HYPH|nr:hypothetical protein BLTE_11620 [Blastochloris tepida]
MPGMLCPDMARGDTTGRVQQPPAQCVTRLFGPATLIIGKGGEGADCPRRRLFKQLRAAGSRNRVQVRREAGNRSAEPGRARIAAAEQHAQDQHAPRLDQERDGGGIEPRQLS